METAISSKISRGRVSFFFSDPENCKIRRASVLPCRSAASLFQLHIFLSLVSVRLVDVRRPIFLALVGLVNLHWSSVTIYMRTDGFQSLASIPESPTKYLDTVDRLPNHSTCVEDGGTSRRLPR